MMMDAVIAFADTNVFLTATDQSRPQHEAANSLIRKAVAGHHQLALSGQVVREYLVVATRPIDVNGLGLSSDDALKNIGVFASPPFAFCEESENVNSRLRSMVEIHALTGKAIHDANVVATMLTSGITTLVTQNPSDFVRYEQIKVIRLDEFGLP